MTSSAFTRAAGAVALIGALALTTTACTAPPSRAGTSDSVVELRSVYGNGAASVGADALRTLLQDTGSPVHLTDVTDGVFQDASTDSDGDAVAAVRAGRGDIAVIRAGRLAEAGADSLLPLQAPTIVTNDEQARRIATDTRVLRSLDGLRRIGLVGLALVPGGLRHPFGYDQPLIDPAQFSGATINIRPDANAAAIVEALGAKADHSVGTERSDAARSGALRGIETSFGQQAAADRPAVVTSNVSLYEKFDVIVIREQVYDGLTPAQQRALRQRTEAAAATALDARASEQDGLNRWCAGVGASSVVASDAAVRAFRTALTPVVEDLRRDPDAAAVIDRMAALHDGTTDPEGLTCAGHATDAAAFDLEPKGDQRVLDGTWRAEATFDELLAATGDDHTAAANAGVWTFHVRNGVAQVDAPDGEPCTIRFTVAGDEVVFDANSDPSNACGGLARGTFRRTDRTIEFTWTNDLDDEVALDQTLLGTFTRVTG